MSLKKIYSEPEISHAYIAGLFDGEGSLCMIETHFKIHPGKKHITCRLSLPNRDKETLLWIKELMGDIGHLYARPKFKEHYYQVWDFSINSFPEILDFSQKISPYIRNKLKKRKFDIMIEYCKLRLYRKENGGLHQPLGEEETRLLEKYSSVGCNY